MPLVRSALVSLRGRSATYPRTPRTSDEMAVADSGSLAAAVAAASRGEAEGWDRLVDRFYGVVRRYAMARLGDSDVADEIAQEVFMAALTGISRLRAHQEPIVEAWFLGIAKNKIAQRARQRRPVEMPSLPGPVHDACEITMTRIEASRVRRALEELTEDQRDVLVRRFVLDHSLQQVATATGRRLGAVKALQHRGLSALSRHLGRRENMP